MNDDLLIRYLLGEASEAEATNVRNRISGDTAYKKHFEQFKAIWDASSKIAIQ